MLKRWFKSGAIGAAVVMTMMFAAMRVAVAKRSAMFFAWYYLDIRIKLHQAIWVRLLLRSRAHLTLAPRGHGKTEIVSKILPLWLICRDRNVRILMVAGALKEARKHAMLIRRILENNKKLIADFGRFYDPKDPELWQQTCFYVVRDTDAKDPTFEAIGIHGSITGGRFDYILGDDIIDPRKVNTPELIQKLIEEWRGTIIPLLEPHGFMWVIGTRKKYGDVYDWLLQQKQWTHTHDRAIIREPKHQIVKLAEPIERPDGSMQLWTVEFLEEDRGECLWAEHQSMEHLLLKRQEIGSTMFLREYQNEVVDDETALFRLSWLEQCRDESLSYIAGHMPNEERDKYQVIFSGVDPSLVTDKRQAEATDSDYMVAVTIGVTRGEERVLLGIERERGLSPDAVKKKITAHFKRFQPYRMAIEKNSFGVLHIENVQKDKTLRLMKHTTGNNKNDPYEGVQHLAPLFENGLVRLPYKTPEDKAKTDSLIQELHAFGSSIHDDQVMATWICCHAILKWLAREALRRRREQKTRR